LTDKCPVTDNLKLYKQAIDVCFDVVDFALNANDFRIAHYGLSTIETLGRENWDEGLWTAEVSQRYERMHRLLFSKLYKEALSFFETRYLGCYRALASEVSKKIDAAIKTTAGHVFDMRQRIDAKYEQLFGERRRTDRRIKKMKKREEQDVLEDNIHPDGIYFDLRDETLRQKDREYQAFVNSLVDHEYRRINSGYGEWKSHDRIPIHKITNIAMQARRKFLGK